MSRRPQTTRDTTAADGRRSWDVCHQEISERLTAEAAGSRRVSGTERTFERSPVGVSALSISCSPREIRIFARCLPRRSTLVCGITTNRLTPPLARAPNPRRARLRGVDVLKALQGAASPSSRCHRCAGDVKDSSPLGVEATARFLRSIGVGFDSHHPSISANPGFGERLSHPRCEAEAPGEADLSDCLLYTSDAADE